jgi:hypothetical protein
MVETALLKDLLRELEKCLGKGEQGRASVIKLISDHPHLASASWDAISPEYGGTSLLHVVASSGDTELARHVISVIKKEGLKIDDIRDFGLCTPMHLGGSVRQARHGQTIG